MATPAEELAFERAAPNHTTAHDRLGTVTVGLGCIVEVASDRNAMLEALAEYGYRMVLEHGADWGVEMFKLDQAARSRVMEKLRDEIKSKQGAVCR